MLHPTRRLARLTTLTLLSVCFVACQAQIESPVNTRAETNERAGGHAGEAKMPDEIQAILLGNVTLDGGRLTLGERWLGGQNAPEIKAGMVFDALDCSGFVARVRVVEPAGKASEGQYGWRVEAVPGGPQADAGGARGKCEDGRAIAVYPSREERSRITLRDRPDLSAVYASLPQDAQKCHAAAHQAYPEYKLGSFDAWADANGDGKIDLVVLTVTCDCTPEDDLICQIILHLSGGVWRQVARITPA